MRKKLLFLLTIVTMLLVVVGCGHTHKYGDWTLVSEPTMEEIGKAERSCEECDETEEVDVPVLSDTDVWAIEVTEATCLEDGKETYSSVYGEVEIILPKLDHDYSDWSLTVDPTKEATGKAERVCSVGNETDVVDVPALTDSSVWSVETTEATCLVEGKETYTSIYGVVEVVLPKTEHTYGDWTLTVEPTKDETGKAKRECSVCDEVDEVVVPVLSNTNIWTLDVTEATCSEEGKETYTSIYGVVEIVLPKTDHTYGDWTLTVAPSKDDTGKAERECSVCGEEEEVVVPVLTDTDVWTVDITEATCLAEGEEVYTSTYGVVKIVLSKLDHDYSDWSLTIKPTKETAGKAERICAVGNETDEVVVPVLTDTDVWALDVTEATCLQEGKELYTSKYGVVEIVLPKTEHRFSDWTLTKAPTKAAAGKAERVCSICGEEDEVVVPVLTDTDVWSVDVTEATCSEEGKETFTSIYGEVVNILPKIDHSFGDWVITIGPTEEETGKAVRECSVCGDTDEVDVPALSDTDTWALEINADLYNEDGEEVYTSIYGVVKLAVSKYVAPYDSQTYTSFSYDMRVDNVFYYYGQRNATTSWNQATLVFNELGIGQGSGAPFGGENHVKMLDPLTGRIQFTAYPYTTVDEEQVPNYDDGRIYNSYVDMETGIIVLPNSTLFNYVHILTPFESGVTRDFTNASSWDNAAAIQYTFEDNIYTIFIYKEIVYFGVSFLDEQGNDVVAEDCYNSPYLYVIDRQGNEIAGFAFDGEKLVEVDGFEGSYSLEDDELFLSGFGTLTYNGQSGTYEIAPTGSDYTIGIYINGYYAELTLDLVEFTYILVEPTVDVTLDGGQFGDDLTETVSKNVEYKLPELTHENQLFKGWFYDEELTDPVVGKFIPSEDTTLYAMWVPLVLIHLENILEGDADTLYLGEGDYLIDYLYKYDKDLENYKIFAGWFGDPEFTNPLREETVLHRDYSGITIYAKWDDLPPYYGTFTGTEVWGERYGNNSTHNITIDENGNITASSISKVRNGKVLEYDPITKKVTYADSKGVLRYFWFDIDAKVIIGIYNDNEIANDFYIMGLNQTTNKMAAHYGVKAPKEPGSTVVNYYAQFVSVMTADGLTDLFMYNNYIYSNIRIEDFDGNTLEINEISKSKTVLVWDDKTNDLILGLVSRDSSFAGGKETDVLDAYFGTYVSGDEEVILDGVGNITYGLKTGSYTKSSSEAYDFDVYLENGNEYYRLTLEGTSFVIDKPMVTIDFVVGEENTPIESQEYNINVVATLPNAEDEGWVFNGWFLDAEFETPLPENFIPTESTTIYAKYSVPAVLTIVYNSNQSTEDIVYSTGDIVNIETPIYYKHAFVGWFTTADFQEGTQWNSGTIITEDMTIYGLWREAGPYNNVYVPTEIEGKDANGNTSKLYTRSSAIIDMDPYGYAFVTSFPFQARHLTVTSYDENTGEIIILATRDNFSDLEYKGFIDPVSGIIILNAAAGLENDFEQVLFLNPFSRASVTSDISSSYWNGGKSRVIEYTFDGITYSAFVYENFVYFGVSFVDKDGVAISGKDCYEADTLYIYDENNKLIAKFGYDGVTMKPLDGFEGIYSSGEDVLELNGVDKVVLNGDNGTYILLDEDTNTFGLYITNDANDVEFFEAILDLDEMTYTITKPMVTITFDGDGKANEPAVTVNKNVEFKLPEPTNKDYIFRGWYTDIELTEEVSLDYIPTKDITLYSKWDLKATVTVIYGNGMENVELLYGIGDTPVLTEPELTNNKIFVAWYLDEDYTEEYIVGELNGDLTIYCKWTDASALYGEYQGTEIWGGSVEGTTGGGTNDRFFEVDPFGNSKGSRPSSGKVVGYDEVTGLLKIVDGNNYYLGFYDDETGLLIVAYNRNTEIFHNNIYIYVKGASKVNAYDCSYWTMGGVNGSVHLASLVIEGSDVESLNIFVYENKVYTGVTWTTSTGDVTARNAYSSNDLTIFDSTGNIIVELERDGSNGLVEVAK